MISTQVSRFAALLALLLTASGGAAQEFRVGTIGQSPSGEIGTHMRFAGWLGEQLKDQGIRSGKVVVAVSIPQMAACLREGRVDLVIDSAYPVLEVERLAGAVLLARRWKKGVAEYRSVIFVRADSPIQSLKQLKGKTIAFEEVFSSSGYFVPRLMLTRAGLRLSPLSGPGEAPSPGAVNFLCSRSDPDTTAWVRKRLVDAGAGDNLSFEHNQSSGTPLRLLASSEALPRQIVACRRDLPAALLKRVKEILCRMHESAEGQKVLADFEHTARFDELTGENLTVLKRLRAVTGRVP